MRELVSDPKVGANFVVLLIFHLKTIILMAVLTPTYQMVPVTDPP